MSRLKSFLHKYLKFTYKFLTTAKTVIKYYSIYVSVPSAPTIVAPSLLTTQQSTQLNSSTVPNENDVQENIANLILIARQALEHGDIEKAEAILEMGAKICDEYGIYTNLPFIYDILSMIAFTLDDFTKCEMILVNAIEKLIKIGYSETDTYIVDFKLRLARMYNLNDEMDLAEMGFKDCLTIQQQKILNGDLSNNTGISYVNCSFWYGLHKIKRNEFKEAKKLINNAYEYSLKIKGLNSYQEMVILYTLTDLNMKLGEYNLALENIQSAILLGKGTGSLDLARCYLKLAKIYIELNVNETAKIAANEALKLALLFSEYETSQEARTILEEIDNK